MTAARSFLRLAFSGLFVSSLAMACVVEDSGDNDELATTPCEDGDFRDCPCPDGETGRRECNAANTGYGQCQCEGSPTAGTSNGGSANNAGEGNTTAGTNNVNYGGEQGTMGGAPTETGGSGPDEAGGAGGSGPVVEPGLCDEDPNDTCANCYQQGCCDQWTACANDNTCLSEFLGIMACTDVIKAERNVVPADLQTCAEDEGAAAGPWSQGVSALTVDMVNCVGGEPEGGWESMPWGAISCKAGCFDN